MTDCLQIWTCQLTKGSNKNHYNTTTSDNSSKTSDNLTTKTKKRTKNVYLKKDLVTNKPWASRHTGRGEPSPRLRTAAQGSCYLQNSRSSPLSPLSPAIGAKPPSGGQGPGRARRTAPQSAHIVLQTLSSVWICFVVCLFMLYLCIVMLESKHADLLTCNQRNRFISAYSEVDIVDLGIQPGHCSWVGQRLNKMKGNTLPVSPLTG